MWCAMWCVVVDMGYPKRIFNARHTQPNPRIFVIPLYTSPGPQNLQGLSPLIDVPRLDRGIQESLTCTLITTEYSISSCAEGLHSPILWPQDATAAPLNAGIACCLGLSWIPRSSRGTSRRVRRLVWQGFADLCIKAWIFVQGFVNG
jgi:hypothetical protein